MPQRYQKEIEDILEQSGKLRRVDGGAGSRIPFRRLVWLWLSRLARGRRWPQPGRLMLIAVCLLLSALLVRAVVPGIAGPLAWAGLLLFVSDTGPSSCGRGESRSGGGGSPSKSPGDRGGTGSARRPAKTRAHREISRTGQRSLRQRSSNSPSVIDCLCAITLSSAPSSSSRLASVYSSPSWSSLSFRTSVVRVFPWA